MYNHNYYATKYNLKLNGTNKEINKETSKECRVVCGIIVCFHLLYIGGLSYIIKYNWEYSDSNDI